VAYAYFFVVDFIVNIFYTILFASIWFLIVADSEQAPPHSKTMNNLKDTAGYVDPVYTHIAQVHVVAEPNANPLTGQHGRLVGVTGFADNERDAPLISSICIGLFWLAKLYFILIVFSYARNLVVRSHISPASFPPNTNFWGKAQRWMLSGKYWGEDDDDYKPVRVVN
jgi:hypothetical protein